ncbi:unnamed protein product [Adineta ricciae]|uniref:PLAT domain-containing protein n=1 Tax=Adineta ricciae TaxID=249248 RepID=A0A814V5P7_ADIRI|nr:unnamed protein product [Adineta ricciae]
MGLSTAKLQTTVGPSTTKIQTTADLPTTKLQTTIGLSTTKIQTTMSLSTTKLQTTLGPSTTKIQTTADLPTTKLQTTLSPSTTKIQTTVGLPTTNVQTTTDLATTKIQTSAELLTTKVPFTTSQSSAKAQTGCFSPKVILIPSVSTLSSPTQFRRSQDFTIISIIELNCNNSLLTSSQWTMKNCTSTCLQQISIDPTIPTTFNELYIPARTLPYGVYEVRLTVTMTQMPSLFSTEVTYIQITPSGITANLVQYGTSMITRGDQQDLQLDPGSYSVDPDQNSFNASAWKYQYYCRIYGLSMFPNSQGSLLTIDDMRNDSSNPSCLSLNRAGWRFDNFINSSLTILAGTLQFNRTYQFMVYMENRRNSSLQATGYVLVNVEETRPQMILIGCVIWTMCQPNLEFQLVNPTTQVALFAVCMGSCLTIQNITWNIYHGSMNSTTNFTRWILFDQTTSYQNNWFFGTNTCNFTVVNQLFLSNPDIELWRFEVVYTFTSETSSSSLNFVINQPPRNGSCSISPLNGTTSTLFDVSCPDWFDEDKIKDYTIYGWTDSSTKKMIVAYSTVPIFQVRLPLGDNQTSLLHLIVDIRDELDCITQYNISSVTVLADSAAIISLVNDIQHSPTRNPIIQLLASGNQNVVGQVITSVSLQFNQMNNENLDQAISNGVPMASIVISSLNSLHEQQLSMSLNQSALDEYNKELNSRAAARDYLIRFTPQLLITTVNHIKLQASTLAQLTQATNELTRETLKTASNRCYQLALTLESMKEKTSYDDVQQASLDLFQCAANLLSAVNGPLQQRTAILNLDFDRGTNFPDDYDTNLELEWAKLSLFADGDDFSWETIQKNRNLYYQKLLAKQISDDMTKLISLLTSSLNINLNVGQDFNISTAQILMSLETKVSQSLSSSYTKQIGYGQVQLPDNFSSYLGANEKISIRSMMQPLASYGNSKLSFNTNLSRSLSFSILDQNQNEIPIRTPTNHSIKLIIPRDPNLLIPSMILYNVTSMNSTPHNLIFNYHYLNLSSTLPTSVHWQIQPLNIAVAYLFIYRFDQTPQLNSSTNDLDGWTLFCPNDLTNESIYTYFVDNQRTAGHQSVIFGLRELNETEMGQRCLNISKENLPITNEPFHFTSNYQLRAYTSGCYYLDDDQQWKSDGLLVGSPTNLYQTECHSTHLTTFASGFVIFPKAVDWSYVFANADFMKNKTVYLTVICASVIYIILIVYARYYDKKDVEKLGVTILADNRKKDQYFYQIIVFTGGRKNAGTKSNVHFILHGNDDQTRIRTLADSHRRILRRSGVDSFLMSVPKSLGLLNCVRIWHDNSGKGSSASWFLKYLIVRDLQTMETFYFICQRWFAVENDDGKIERVLPVAGELETRQFSFVITKRTYHSISDGHLWFSIFSRPPSNQFTRVQRCTCCFVLFFVSMFLNIMYYDLSNEAKSTNASSISFGSLYISPRQVVIGIIVEFFAFIPSLLLVQFFRRLHSRRKRLSPVRKALSQVTGSLQDNPDRKSPLTFPWWCIFIAYGLCVTLVSLSILFIIARGIEFGDTKTQKWLTSILSGFVSSILFTQPLKIVVMAIFFTCFCRKSQKDREANEFLDDDQIGLEADEDYFHKTEKKSMIARPSSIRPGRLSEADLIHLRQQRLKEIHMWTVIREILMYICFISVLYVIVYSNPYSNAFLQANHLRKYFLNSRQTDLDLTKVSTIDEYWQWLESSFVENLRAQKWYNGDPPRNLSGFINDKSHRLIGWATMRQLRVKSEQCRIVSTCHADYSFFNEDKHSYTPTWLNETLRVSDSPVEKAFTYQSSDELDTFIYAGNYASYGSGGYVYEFRGGFIDVQNNISRLHALRWIDEKTRAVIIQLTLYNPNVRLFTAVTILAEFLSSGGVFTSARFEPISFDAFVSRSQLLCTIIYMLLVVYFMWIELRSFIELKRKYFCQFWSYVQLGLIVCSWTSVGIYTWRYNECQRIGQLFSETNGYVYINLQFASYVNDLLTYLLGFCCFFGTIQLIRLCRFNPRLCLFVHTLQHSAKELLSFMLMFAIMFMSFLCLFYLLFMSQLPECASLLGTAQMLFEMTLMKFDTHDLSEAAAFLGPFCFSLFIVFVVFICISMFLSIVADNFRRVRATLDDKSDGIFSFMFERFHRWTGWKKITEEEDMNAERNQRLSGQYYHPADMLSKKIDELLYALDRVCNLLNLKF